MSSNSTFPILTPDTPLAFLDRTTGLQFEASCYLYIATLSAYIWELLTSVPEEVKIVRNSRFGLPIFAYFLSRVGTLVFIVTSTIFQVAPVGNCQYLQVALGWCFAVAVPATASLFFFRIAAVFHANKPVVIFFMLAWLATLGSSIIVPFSLEGKHIAATARCINASVKPFAAAGTVANACTDTLVFLALSWRLTYNTPAHGLVGRSKSMVSGSGLPKFSRALLQNGQLYYLSTVGVNILTMIMLLDPAMPPVFHAMFAIPNVALENAMACRVFRALRLGFITDNESGEIPTSVFWTSFIVTPAPVPKNPLGEGNNHSLGTMPRRSSRVGPLNIEIAKTVNTMDDGGPEERGEYSKRAMV
ncbi:hypothetical protein B0H10DRAFT_1791708 [Mycena sp. CBHHK59/15]|nr:hypothetical protein B0H10DRAFT_1791708 [Mycena sp. CBHHK59/15]